MAHCVYCKAKTELHTNGCPICIQCDQKMAALVRDLADSTMQADAASDEFLAVMTEIPSGMPHPDGREKIKNVSQKLRAAREQMSRAEVRLNEFQTTGVVPEGAMAQNKK